MGMGCRAGSPRRPGRIRSGATTSGDDQEDQGEQMGQEITSRRRRRRRRILEVCSEHRGNQVEDHRTLLQATLKSANSTWKISGQELASANMRQLGERKMISQTDLWQSILLFIPA